MAITTFLSPSPNEAHQTKNMNMKNKKNKKKNKKVVVSAPSPTSRTQVRDHQVSSWEQLKSLLSCRAIGLASQVHDPSKKPIPIVTTSYTKLRSSCGPSMCAFRDVVHGGSTRVGHRSDTDRNSGSSSPGESRRHETAPLTRPSAGGSCSSSRAAGLPLGRFSGCYECHAISVDSASRRYPRPRTLCACSECGEVFTKPESLELHQTIRHAVSELGTEDSGRHVVEIIFKSSWHRRALPACKIERILKVRNGPRTVARFEEFRAAVKSRALNPKKHPRCAADGNELLRFHAAALSCALGSGSGSSLCSSPACDVCGIIRHGFARGPCGVRTTASSGRAHELGHAAAAGGSRAMLVCRVIAGRVRHAGDDDEGGPGGNPFDSVAGPDANLEDLSVGHPRAILPCFVVIYRLLV
ncbi:hypothetical protein J5N97_021596 [Dioscorea zingiberensis]|uniref:C2H2-type domain-containing protein n=1 Tax=Dioscorea zingiberensis TaxID=325984 RepID=A0A9D5H9U4_9LILI|nr:hypothetical protein J5N97_021596 [Dioscorea zingiberensis]